MKKIILNLFALVALIYLNSCDNEPLEGFDLANPAVATTNPDGSNGNVTGGTSTGDYFPRAIDNEWTYSFDVNGSTQTLVSKLTNSFIDNSNTVFESEQNTVSVGTTAITVSGFLYKTGGVYTATQTGLPNYIFLKDNVPVGTTWSVSYSQTTSYTPSQQGIPNIPDAVTNTTIDYEIEGKDLSVVVNGVTYSPVINVKATNTSVIAGTNIETENISYNFYALDIGLIKIESTGTDSNGSSTTTESLLTSYILN
jgi:hypothetical protein